MKSRGCSKCGCIWKVRFGEPQANCPKCGFDQQQATRITKLEAENERLRKMLERCWDALDCVKAGERVSSETAHFYWNIRDDVRRTLDAALTKPT